MRALIKIEFETEGLTEKQIAEYGYRAWDCYSVGGKLDKRVSIAGPIVEGE